MRDECLIYVTYLTKMILERCWRDYLYGLSLYRTGWEGNGGKPTSVMKLGYCRSISWERKRWAWGSCSESMWDCDRMIHGISRVCCGGWNENYSVSQKFNPSLLTIFLLRRPARVNLLIAKHFAPRPGTVAIRFEVDRASARLSMLPVYKSQGKMCVAKTCITASRHGT
jgi:hypothetical protein